MPSMSTDGWIEDPLQVADYLMSHFFLSEYSQTALFPKEVTSLPYIMYKNQGSPQNTSDAIKDRLAIYFSRYFTDVVVQTAQRDDPTDATKAIIDCFIEFRDHLGKVHSFAKSAEIIDNKFNRIVHINNFVGEG